MGFVNAVSGNFPPVGRILSKTPPFLDRKRGVFVGTAYIQMEKTRSTFSRTFRSQDRSRHRARSTGALAAMMRYMSARMYPTAGAPWRSTPHS